MSTAKKGVRLAGPSDRTGNGLKSPWYSLHTGRLLQKFHELNESRKGFFWAKIYPSGVMLQAKMDYEKTCPKAPPRGSIQGFSHASARRLKEAFMTLYVPGFDLWAFTLTTHQFFSPEEWRSISMRFRQAVKYAGWAGIWRVELQRRKTPHDHVAFWLPPGVTHDYVARAWLIATGEVNDAEAREHAVHSQRIKQDQSGWAVYMSLHNGKHKEVQLGWQGKQWGIWNRSAFMERKPEVVEITPRTHQIFLRVLVNFENAQRRRHISDYWAKYLRLSRAGFTLPAHEALKKWNALRKRPLLRKSYPGCTHSIHRGNLLRCIKGETISTVLRAVTEGRIYHASTVKNDA